MQHNSTLKATAVVIFGGRGNLAWRKLVPALFDLLRGKRLPEPFAICAVDRVEMNAQTLQDHFREGVKRFSRGGVPLDAEWERFQQMLTYQRADFDDPATYSRLSEYLARIDAQWDAKANRVFYLATPPMLFGEIARRLGEAGLSRGV